MQSADSNNNDGFLLSVDPFSGQILAAYDTGLIIRFNDLTELRRFCCSLIERSNRSPTYWTALGKPKARSSGISKRYSKKVIKEWEAQLQDAEIDQNALEARPEEDIDGPDDMAA